MKIITPGRLPDLIEIRAACSNCGTVFEFTPKEATRQSDQRDGGYYEIPCPLCGKVVTRDARSRS